MSEFHHSEEAPSTEDLLNFEVERVESVEYPVFPLRKYEVPVFLTLGERFGLSGIISSADTFLRLSERGIEQFRFSIEEVAFLERLALWTTQVIPNDSKLIFRKVNGDPKNGIQVQNILQEANIHGGRHPEDTSAGFCVGHDKVIDYSKQNDPKNGCVIFIYNNDELEGLTHEEREVDRNLRFYGMKPRPGKTARDALLAAVVIPEMIQK